MTFSNQHGPTAGGRSQFQSSIDAHSVERRVEETLQNTQQLVKEAETRTQVAITRAKKEESRVREADARCKALSQQLKESNSRASEAKKRVRETEVTVQPSIYHQELKRPKSVHSETKQNIGREIHGVDVCAETTITVTNTQQQFHWEHYGLTLDFPEGCLPSNVNQCSVNIKASLTGQYEFPKSSYRVSAVYWLQCEPKFKFATPILVSIQHCALRENVSKLSFVRAHCTQKQLPYTFKPLEARGTFTEHSSHGFIQLESFSAYTVTQEGSEERQYCASIYYIPDGNIYSRDIEFVVTWDLEAHHTFISSHFEKREAKKGPASKLEFDASQVSLDIPLEKWVVDDWRIEPLNPPVVTKKQVDEFTPGKLIPSCQLTAVLMNPNADTHTVQSVVSFLWININGAKAPHNRFKLVLRPWTEREATPSDVQRQRTRPIIYKSTGHTASPPEDKPMLQDLFKEFLPRAFLWENLGLLLGIDDAQLKTIKANHNDVASRLREMFRVWLERVDPPPSWPNIIEAIEVLRNEQLAMDLKHKYKC